MIMKDFKGDKYTTDIFGTMTPTLAYALWLECRIASLESELATRPSKVDPTPHRMQKWCGDEDFLPYPDSDYER